MGLFCYRIGAIWIDLSNTSNQDHRAGEDNRQPNQRKRPWGARGGPTSPDPSGRPLPLLCRFRLRRFQMPRRLRPDVVPHAVGLELGQALGEPRHAVLEQ